MINELKPTELKLLDLSISLLKEAEQMRADSYKMDSRIDYYVAMGVANEKIAIAERIKGALDGK